MLFRRLLTTTSSRIVNTVSRKSFSTFKSRIVQPNNTTLPEEFKTLLKKHEHYVRTGKGENAQTLLLQVLQKAYVYDKEQVQRAVNMQLKHYAESREVDKALNIFLQYLNTMILYSPTFEYGIPLHTMLTLLGTEDITRVERFVRDLKLHPSYESSTMESKKNLFLMLVNVYASMGDFDNAFHWLNEMEGAVGITDTSFSSFFHYLAETSNVTGMVEIMRIMITRFDVKPGTKFFNIVIKACNDTGDLQLAKEMLQTMFEHRIAITTYTFNLLLDLYVNSDDVVSANDALMLMKDMGVPRNSVTYGSIMKGYRNGNTGHDNMKFDVSQVSRRLKRVYLSMIKDNIEPDTVIYNIMFSGRLTHQVFLFIINDMLKRNVRPDLLLYSNLVYQQVFFNVLSSAESYAEEAYHRQDLGPQGDLFRRIYLDLLHVYADLSNIDLVNVKKWYNRMKDRLIDGVGYEGLYITMRAAYYVKDIGLMNDVYSTVVSRKEELTKVQIARFISMYVRYYSDNMKEKECILWRNKLIDDLDYIKARDVYNKHYDIAVIIYNTIIQHNGMMVYQAALDNVPEYAREWFVLDHMLDILRDTIMIDASGLHTIIKIKNKTSLDGKVVYKDSYMSMPNRHQTDMDPLLSCDISFMMLYFQLKDYKQSFEYYKRAYDNKDWEPSGIVRKKIKLYIESITDAEKEKLLQDSSDEFKHHIDRILKQR